jgi:hypothetical protein
LPPGQHTPRPPTLPHALVATPGEQRWIMRVRNWMNKDAERCCSMHACMHHFETFLHSTRHTHTTQRMRKSTSICTHACTLQRMHVYTSTHAPTHTHAIYGMSTVVSSLFTSEVRTRHASTHTHARIIIHARHITTQAYDTLHTLLFGNSGRGGNNLRSGPETRNRQTLPFPAQSSV